MAGVAHSISSQAFIQQRIRHVYRRQRPTPLPSRTAKNRDQSQLAVDGLVAGQTAFGARAWPSRQSVAGQVDDDELRRTVIGVRSRVNVRG